MNISKIRQIGEDILAEHRRFSMDSWMMKLFKAGASPQERRKAAKEMGHSLANYPPCGTTACFAGAWAIRYRGVDPRLEDPFRDLYASGGSVGDRCRRDLDLPNDNRFFDSHWPERARARLARMRPGTKTYARFFVEEVLEDYIETGGWRKPSRRFA